MDFLEDGDIIEVNLNENELNCEQLSNPDIYRVRKSWEKKLTKILIFILPSFS